MTVWAMHVTTVPAFPILLSPAGSIKMASTHTNSQPDFDLDGVGDACGPTIRVELTPTDGNSTYDTWLPEDGKIANVRVYLQDKNGAQITNAQIDLGIDISHEKGVCFNDESENEDPDYTVVEASGPIDYEKDLTITSHDFGGSILITATADYNGSSIVRQFRIPKDSDNDFVPDVKEQEYGLDPTNPDTDGDGIPDGDEDGERSANNEGTGDGIKLRHEIRGVMWQHGQETVPTFRRLDPTRKNLFVYFKGFPADFTVSVGHAFEGSGIEVLWTTHDPAGWTRGLDVLVVKYSNLYSSMDTNKGHIRWFPPGENDAGVLVRRADIPVLGESSFGNAVNYAQPVVYGTAFSSLKNDKPYRDGGGLHANAPAANGLLDPLSDSQKVEDKNDNNIFEKRIDVDTYQNGALDGDVFSSTDVTTWNNQNYLSPFDIDHDGYMELPMQYDPVVAVKGTKKAFEYEEPDWALSVLTHEIGHAVGMGEGKASSVDNLGHCFDKNCVMYQYSNNWDRGVFCPYHQSRILIHNHLSN